MSGVQEIKGDVTNLGDFVRGQKAPLVVIKFGASWCGPCKEIQPVFETLAGSGAPIISCFSVDVDECEELAVEAGVSKLPTFIFYTTQLSPDKSTLMVVDQIIGPDHGKLKEQFAKGYQVVSGFLASQKPTPAPPVAPAATHQQTPPPVQVQVPQQQQQQQQPARPNDIVKREIVEIRAGLVAAMQRLEKLYMALQ